jgi:putative addiction module antidote
VATTVKIISIGNSAGIVLPREVMERLHVEKRDKLFLTETPDGVRLTPYAPGMSAKLAAGEKIMRENREVLRKLAE